MVKLVVKLLLLVRLATEVPTVPASARAPVTLRALAVPPPPTAATTILRSRRNRQPRRRMFHIFFAPEPRWCPSFNLIVTRALR